MARHDAIPAQSEVLPVPPLPEMTAKTCATPCSSRMFILTLYYNRTDGEIQWESRRKLRFSC